jgi:HlyD family secretion protein
MTSIPLDKAPRRRGRRWPWLLAGLGSAVVAAGVGISQSGLLTPPPLAADQTAEVTRQTLAVQIQANGTVVPVRKVNLAPKEAGRVLELLVDEGDRISEGQLIARMDSEQLQAQVNQQRANLARAQANLAQRREGNRPEEVSEAQARTTTATASIAEAQVRVDFAQREAQRQRQLAQDGAIARRALDEAESKLRQEETNLATLRSRLTEQQQSQERVENGSRPTELAQAQAEVAQAEAQLDQAETQLRNTEIRAPFGGILTRRYAQVGDFVTPATAASSSEGASSSSIAELLSGLEIEAKVPEANLDQIQQGQLVEIRADAYPSQVFKGRVRLIAPRAVTENNITTLRVKIKLETGQQQLKPGVNVRLSFQVKSLADSLAVPAAAVVPQPDGKAAVYLAPDPADPSAKAKLQPIQVGLTVGDKTQVMDGLKPGDRILLQPPPEKLIDGIDNTRPAGGEN